MSMLLINFISVVLTVIIYTEAERTFRIDNEANVFLKDGKPFRYVSGEIHYFRIPSQLWRDRLHKVRMGGLNAIQIYIEWSLHEPQPGQFLFDGDQDIRTFLQIAQEEDLLVILRPGPYICAERDLGGIPSWIHGIDPNIRLRSSDKRYEDLVKRWYDVLLPIIKPFLYINGGPIITVQVENEYGNFGPVDLNHKLFLRELLRSHLGPDVVLFTTDQNYLYTMLRGKVPDVHSTIDFGTTAYVPGAFDNQRLVQPNGPLVNSEFYVGWFDHWNESHSTVSIDKTISSLDEILARNASVSLYMYHGGTNFWLRNGGNYGNSWNYLADPTSYDYDAPLSEGGDPTPKYFAIRDVIAKYMDVPSGPLPVVQPKGSYGEITLNYVNSLFNLYPLLSSRDPVVADRPLTFEQLNQAFGYVAYEVTIKESSVLQKLSIPGLADRVYVFVDQKLVTTLQRSIVTSADISINSGQKLTIIVENQGRISYVPHLKDLKGIVGNVTLGGKVITGPWTHFCLPLNNTGVLPSPPTGSISKGYSLPAVFKAEFVLPGKAMCTYLDSTGWGKGVAVINGIVLGRYWPSVGPQVTLYVPGVYLNDPPATNTLTLVEMERCNCRPNGTGTVNLVNTPNLFPK